MSTTRKASIIAGLWYVLVAIFGALNSAIVEPRLYVPGDAAATVSNILASQGLFRLGILSNLVCTICFLFLAGALYKLFESVDKDAVRLMVIFILASVPVAYVEAVKFAPILLSADAAYLSSFTPAQLQALGVVYLDLHKQGALTTYIFYGLWLFPLGLLVFKSRSGVISKAVGAALMIGCFGYLGKFLNAFLSLGWEGTVSAGMTIAIVAEIACIVWLLTKGPGEQRTAAR